ncbi:MFS transporter [Streptomyces sp. IMTB 2501]|uniref:MFS transporter n=1 Tax=Streptomyces sp. IMTB 2501 TaxID=1776340 RepID=UPI0009A1A6A8
MIAARAVQGLGAAVMMPQTPALIRAVFPAERSGAAFGVWSAVAGLATVAGPAVGGDVGALMAVLAPDVVANSSARATRRSTPAAAPATTFRCSPRPWARPAG